jgi:hypothetical protein
MANMKRLIAVAVVVAGVAIPGFAQRGGGGHSGGGSAGHSVGGASRGSSFAGHTSPAFRGSVPAMGRVNFMGVPQVSSSRYAAARLTPSPGPVAGFPGRSPGSSDRRSGYRRAYTPVYGLGVSTGFNIWPGSLLDPGFYDGPGFYNAYSDSGYANPAPPAGDATQPEQVEQAEVAPPDAYRPPYAKPQLEPEPEAAVTLVFKDGRPAEQIHNYMLTRTTLYVQDEHRREIPIDDLDLAATQKINKDDGVDFQLPGASR